MKQVIRVNSECYSDLLATLEVYEGIVQSMSRADMLNHTAEVVWVPNDMDVLEPLDMPDSYLFTTESN